MRLFHGAKALLVSTIVCAVAASSCATGEKKLSDTEKAKLYIDLAMSNLQEHDTVSALTALNDAEKLDSSLPQIYHARAEVFYFKHDLATAVTEVRKALKMDPKFSGAENTLGKFLIDQGKLDEAIPHLLKAASDPLYREADKAYTNLAIIYYKRNDYPKSLTYLDKAIEAAPVGACVAYYYRGHIRLRQSRFSDAIHDYHEATRQFCASFADAHFALGLAYEYAKQYTDARKKYMEVSERFPNTALSDQALERLRGLP